MSVVYIISAPSGSGKSTLVNEIEKLVPGLDFSICRVKPTQPHEGQPAPNELFPFELRGNLLKGGTVRNDDGLGRRAQACGNGGLLSPLNDLIRGYAERGDHDQKDDENAPQLHQCCRLSANRRP